MRIGFIGAGNMAGALGAAIAASDADVVFAAYDVSPGQLDRFASQVPRSQAAGSNTEVVRSSDVTFLAVKPQGVDSVFPEIRDTDALIASIVAGVRISRMEAALPRARIVRVMPNTPALVGEMAAGYAGGSRAGEADLQLVGALLERAGVAIRLPEELLDAVTGVAGSGPAFVARLIEAFVDAAAREGLPRDVATRLVLATFSGTARLLERKQLTPDELVAMVSSKGGTTVAGRRVLESSDMHATIRQTIATAVARSKELGT